MLQPKVASYLCIRTNKKPLFSLADLNYIIHVNTYTDKSASNQDFNTFFLQVVIKYVVQISLLRTVT